MTHDSGWRDSSGFDEQKLNAVWTRPLGDGGLDFRLAGFNLDQQTAGFIVGEDAYRDPALALDHYGWIGFPVRQIDGWRVAGALFVVTGMFLLARE